MKKIIITLLILFASSTQFSAQQNEIAFKVFSPQFPKYNSEFEISLLASDQVLSNDNITLLIFTDESLELIKYTIRNVEYELVVDKLNKWDASGSESYRIAIPEKFIAEKDNIFQVNLTFMPRNISTTEIDFRIETSKLSEKDETSSIPEIWEIDLPSVSLDLYDVKNLRQKALLIKDGSKLSIQFAEEIQTDNLLINFWAKSNSNRSPLFIVVNPSVEDTVISLGKTRFGIVRVPENLSEFDFNEGFIGELSFNNYTVLLSAKDYSAKLYINGKLIYSAPYYMNYALNELVFEFHSGTSSYLLLDELKFIELKDEIEDVFRNIHYSTFLLQESKILYSENFDIEDEKELISRSDNLVLKIDEAKLIKAETPIYSRTPSLKVSTLESMYELSWNNHDDANVSYYEIEKSLDGQNYESLVSLHSTNDPAHNYFYVDSRNELDEIVFYRIKQLNKDGSTNYSSGVKLGTAQLDYFNIEQNYPNPFNPSTSISVEVFIPAEYEITIYDLVGTKVDVVHKGPLSQGMHVFEFDGSNLTSGVYIFEVSSPFSNNAIKMILAK